MSFVEPHFLWLFLLAAPLVLLLSLRRRRASVGVSSMALWRELVPAPPRVRLPFGWPPRRWLSLILLLLALGALVFALARPRWGAPPPRRVVAVVDVSASMGALSAGSTRLAHARREVGQLGRTLLPGDLLWIVTAGDSARCVTGPLEGRYGGVDVFESLPERPQAGGADLSGGLALAAAFGPTEVWLWTDGGSDEVVVPATIAPRWIRPGPASHDLRVEGCLEAVGKTLRLEARALNVGSVSGHVDPQVLVDGELLVQLPGRSLAAGQELDLGTLELPRLPEDRSSRIELRLRTADDLPMNDRLSWEVPPLAPLRVALHDPAADRFLAAALAVDGGVVPVGLDDRQAAVVVQTDVLPSGVRPRAALPRLRIGPRALPADLPAAGVLEAPAGVLVRGGHEILRGVSLDGLLVPSLPRTTPGADWQILASADGVPLLLVRDGEPREVVVPFDPAQTDLVLRRGFPLLVSSSVRWLTRHRPAGPRWVRAGYRLPSEGTAPEHYDPHETTLRKAELQGARASAPPDGEAPLDPRRLWLLVAALALFLEGALAWKARRHVPSTVARAVLLCLLVLAWFDPSVSASPAAGPRAVVAVVDVSDSVDEAAAQDIVRGLRRGLGPGDRLSVLAVGAAPAVVAGDVLSSAGVDRSETDLAAGLRWAPVGFTPGLTPEVVVVSDGRETQGNARLESRLLRQRAVSVRFVEAPVAGADAVLTGFTADRAWAARGEGLSLTAAFEADVPARVSMALVRVDAAGEQRVWERVVEVGAGKTRVSFDDVAGPRGAQRYRLRFPGSDDRHLVLPVRSGPRALLAEGAAGLGDLVSGALHEAGFELEVRDPQELASDLAVARSWDLVVLVDVPTEPGRGGSPLPAPAQRALARYVEEGGGLLVIGGQRSYGYGGYADSPLDDILPLRSEPPSRGKIPSVALLLVIDRSASMRGPKLALAKLAARDTLRHLAPRDLLGVIGFAAKAHWSVPLGPAMAPEEAAAQVDLQAAGGGTDLVPALALAGAALRAREATIKHVVAISDGIAPREEELLQLARGLAADGITLSTVALGGDADQGLMGRLARAGGGAHHSAIDPQGVPRLVVDEARRATRLATRERFRPRLVLPSESVRGIPWASAPELLGRAPSKAKPGAQVWVDDAAGAPLLAGWDRGLGRIVCWTSDGGQRWAAPWLDWAGYPRLLRQVARVLSPPPPPVGGAASFVFDRAGGVEVRGPTDATAVEAIALSESADRRRAPLESVGSGRFRAQIFEPAQRGDYIVRALRDQAVLGEVGVHLPLPGSERKGGRAKPDLLRALSGGGSPSPLPWGLGAPLLVGAALLLLLDVGLRVGRGRLARRRTPQLHSM